MFYLHLGRVGETPGAPLPQQLPINDGRPNAQINFWDRWSGWEQDGEDDQQSHLERSHKRLNISSATQQNTTYAM